jgi:hypothetical protein
MIHCGGMSSPSEAASGKGGTGNALAGTASFLFRTMTPALSKYLQSFSEMSVHIGSASLRPALSRTATSHRSSKWCTGWNRDARPRGSIGPRRRSVASVTSAVTMLLGERIADEIWQEL